MTTLVIGKDITPARNPTNTFEFVISQMSGDADSYNEESIKIEDAEESINMALLLECIKSYSDGYHNTAEEMAKAITKTLPEDVINSAIANCNLHDCIWDLVGHDVTCGDGQFLASLAGYEIFWYNEFGIKFEVSLVK